MATVRDRLVPAAVLLALCLLAGAPLKADSLPAQISDAEFWRMIGTFSEPNGSFTSENFVSNETGVQRVIPALKATTDPGGVYIGVGPEQNLTYIAALQPHIAFVIDIRRQNMLQHLVYKAAFDLSEDRADFLAHLFSRKRPAGPTAELSAAELLQAFKNRDWDHDLYQRNLQSILDNLIVSHHFALTVKDKDSVEHVMHAFFDKGADLTYGYDAGSGVGTTPSFADLQSETDGAGGQAQNWSFLATEENFRRLKVMESRNLLIPIVGDFAGPKAIRSVARYLADHQAPVTAFYTSNVERYLFEDKNKWKTFYANVGQLPLDSKSTFIRAVLTPRTTAAGRGRAAIRSVTLLCSITEVLTAVREGRITIYEHVSLLSR